MIEGDSAAAVSSAARTPNSPFTYHSTDVLRLAVLSLYALAILGCLGLVVEEATGLFYGHSSGLGELSEPWLALLFSALPHVIGTMCFALWIYIAVGNAHALGAPLEFPPGLAVAWWIIPGANVVMPYLSMAALSATVDGGVEIATVRWWWGAVLSMLALGKAIELARAQHARELASALVGAWFLACLVAWVTLAMWTGSVERGQRAAALAR